MFDMLIGLATTNESILDFLLRVLQEFGDEVVNRQQTSLLNQQRVSLIVTINHLLLLCFTSFIPF